MDDDDLLSVADVLDILAKANSSELSKENPDPSKLVPVTTRSNIDHRIKKAGITPVTTLGKGKAGRTRLFKRSDIVKLFPVPEDVSIKEDFYRSEEVPTTVPVQGKTNIKRGKKGEGIVTYNTEPSIGSRLVYRQNRLKRKLADFDRASILKTGITSKQQIELDEKVRQWTSFDDEEGEVGRTIKVRGPEVRKAEGWMRPTSGNRMTIPRRPRNLSNQFGEDDGQLSLF